HAGPAHELAQWTGLDRRSLLAIARSDQLRDPLRIGTHELDERKRNERDTCRREPRDRERVSLERLPGEHGAEDRRPEDRPEDRTEEDVRDAARAALGRIHVARGGPDEQGDATGRADQAE